MFLSSLSLPRDLVKVESARNLSGNCQCKKRCQQLLICFIVFISIFSAAPTEATVVGTPPPHVTCGTDGASCELQLNATETVVSNMMKSFTKIFNKYQSNNLIDEGGLSNLMKDFGLLVEYKKNSEQHEHDHDHEHAIHKRSTQKEDHSDHSNHSHDNHNGHSHATETTKSARLNDSHESDADHSGHGHVDETTKLDDSHEGHDHEGHDHEGHDHEGHDHEGHDHEGHDHEGHDHEAHDHESHEGHDHEGHDHNESYKPEKCGLMVEIKNEHITSATQQDLHLDYANFFTVLPKLILEKINGRSCLYTAEHEANHGDKTKHAAAADDDDAQKVWLVALSSVTLISFLSIIGLLTVPLMKYSKFYERFMAFLVALAIGTLVGDAILHLLPHATESHDEHGHGDVHEHSAAGIYKNLVVVLGIYLFFLFESSMLLYRNRKNVSKSKSASADVGNTGRSQEGIEFQDSSMGVLIPEVIVHKSKLDEAAVDVEQNSDTTQDDDEHRHHHHCHHDQMKVDSKAGILDMAWMIIAGDGLHNFSDGLAIGAAFSSNIAAGMSTSFAIFFHELPHELGDFAVLIKAGMSIKQALMYNLMSACLAFVGVIIGILIGEYTSNFKSWVLALTAGTFLYVALVNMLPELLKSVRSDVKKFAIAQIGLLSGIGCMLLIALYEGSIQSWF